MTSFAADQCFDCLPDPLGGGLNLAVPDVSVTQGHTHTAVTEQARDNGQGHAPDFDGWAGFWLVSRLEISANTMT